MIAVKQSDERDAVCFLWNATAGHSDLQARDERYCKLDEQLGMQEDNGLD